MKSFVWVDAALGKTCHRDSGRDNCVRSRMILLESWGDMHPLWQDDAARAFEHTYLSKMLECLENIEHEFNTGCHQLGIES